MIIWFRVFLPLVFILLIRLRLSIFFLRVKKEPPFLLCFCLLFLCSSGSKFIKYLTPCVPKQKQIFRSVFVCFFSFIIFFCVYVCVCFYRFAPINMISITSNPHYFLRVCMRVYVLCTSFSNCAVNNSFTSKSTF